MNQSILLRGARQLLTLRGTPGVRRGSESGNLAIIEDGSVLVQGGKIASVGPTRRIENLKEARDAIEIPVRDCVVMPGFVDPAIRLSLATSNRAGKIKRLKLNDFYSQSVNLMRACLQHGTLNAGVIACSGVESVATDLSVLRQLVRIGSNPIGLTRIWRPSEDCSAILQKTLKRGHANQVALRSDLAAAAFDSLRAAAEQAGMTPHLEWISGSASDLAETLQRCPISSTFCPHDLTAEESTALATSSATAVFSVGGRLLEGEETGVAVSNVLKAGGAVALGSGYDAAHEPNFNMQLVVALAVMRLRLTIEQALVASTINAAYAIDRGDEVGSLEPGKRADVLVLMLSDYREIPRRMGVNHVAMAIRDGNVVINRTRWRVGAA